MTDVLTTATTSGTYICSACNQIFNRSEQRTHAKSEWHRYNLKRRLANLNPITEKTFSEKVVAANSEVEDGVERRCEVCDVTFSSRSAWSRHLGSQTHALKKAETASVALETRTTSLGENAPENDEENSGQDAQDALGSEDTQTLSRTCAFCNAVCKDSASTIEHISTEHGTFIPDVEFLSLQDDFILELAYIVFESNSCTYCGKTRDSKSAIQTHMRDTGHMMLNYEMYPDLLECFDFSSYDDEDEEEDEPTSLDASGLELRLPSGRVLGHRSNARYFRQNLHSYPSPAERMAQLSLTDADADNKSNEHETNVSRQQQRQDRPSLQSKQLTVRASDKNSLAGLSDQAKRSLVLTQQKALKTENRARDRARATLERKNNANLMKHFKSDVPGPKLG